jgi:hypothetical protein
LALQRNGGYDFKIVIPWKFQARRRTVVHPIWLCGFDSMIPMGSVCPDGHEGCGRKVRRWPPEPDGSLLLERSVHVQQDGRSLCMAFHS